MSRLLRKRPNPVGIATAAALNPRLRSSQCDTKPTVPVLRRLYKWPFARAASPVAALGALILACGSDGPPGLPERTFNSLSVDPTSAVICTLDPGNIITITATPLDKNGQRMTGLGNPSFANSNANAVAVDANGLVRALADGTAHITASLTANGTTRTAVATITVVSSHTGDVPGAVSGNHPLPHTAIITVAQT